MEIIVIRLFPYKLSGREYTNAATPETSGAVIEVFEAIRKP